MTLYYKLKFQAFDIFYFSDFESMLNKAFGKNYKKQINQKFGIKVEFLGPVRLPLKNRFYTVNRSHHVNKKSRDQFKLTTHTTLWIIKITIKSNLSSQVIKKIEENIQINLFKILREIKKNNAVNLNLSYVKKHAL